MINHLEKDLRDREQFLRRIEKELKLSDRFNSFEIDDLSDTEILPIIDEVILNKLMQDILNHTISADTVISVAEKRRTMAWHDLVEDYYAALYWAAPSIPIEQLLKNTFSPFAVRLSYSSSAIATSGVLLPASSVFLNERKTSNLLIEMQLLNYTKYQIS